MPQITHRDLVSFADDKVNLKKTEVDDQRAQVNRLRDRIEDKIAASPGGEQPRRLPRRAGGAAYRRICRSLPVRVFA